MKPFECEFVWEINNLRGNYYHTSHKNNQAGYYAIMVIFDDIEKFDLLDEKLESKNFEFYYPEVIGG